jgi:transaldolase
MDIYLDSADPAEIHTARGWGLLDGVTTNPAVLARVRGDLHGVLAGVCEASPGPVFCQVLGHHDVDDLLAQARWLYAFSPRITVKLPMTVGGLQALTRLKAEFPGRQACVTVVSSVAQAYLAAKLGADVVALFNGPLEQAIDQDVDLVAPVRRIYQNYGFRTRILSCGRFPRAFGEFAVAGSDICTLRFEFLKLLFEHPYTDKRLVDFDKDWRAAHGAARWGAQAAAARA